MFERLTNRQTIKHADGTEHIETYCRGHRYGPAAFPSKYGTSNPQEYRNYCEMVDRLAAYEDTGLTPERIRELQNAFNILFESERQKQQENEQLRAHVARMRDALQYYADVKRWGTVNLQYVPTPEVAKKALAEIDKAIGGKEW
jgi:hypothetical protein